MKYILFFLIMLIINTFISYLTFLGMNSYDVINEKLLIKAFFFALLISTSIFYTLRIGRKKID